MDRKRLIERFSVVGLSTIAVIAALMILLFDGRDPGNGERAAGRSFQQAVCGLGIGAALRPDWGFASYDPRVDAHDETSLWPVPGGYDYSPDRGMMGDDARDAGGGQP